MPVRKLRLTVATSLVLALATAVVSAQAPPKVTSPKEQFGFNIGDDYQLVNYTQLIDYWNKLDRESDRMVVQEIGRTAEGRPHLMAVITSPENHKKLDRYQEIARRLALAEGLTDDEARALAAEGKCVVWIDGGLHATEVLGAQQLIETVHQLVSRTDAETMRFLNDCIILCVAANPDGMELVSNWYMREPDPVKRSTSGVPRLYQKYIGHDNNRDFYMNTQPESQNMSRVMYLEWYPQIMYNHHQSGPAGTVLFASPFRDPFNYNFDPLVPLGIEMVGAAIHRRLASEGKPGSTMRTGASYSTWFNGSVRTTAYFHNMIGILTETIGNPTPVDVPFILERQLPSGDMPYPVAPGKWYFRQSIEYSLTNNRAVLDIASRYREDFLFNIYRMGKNAIERGSRDTWTIHPKRIEAVLAAAEKERLQQTGQSQSELARRDPRTVPLSVALYNEILHDPTQRDPRGYIIPSDQPDFLTATKFVNALLKSGVVVHRAASRFQVGGRTFPAGSYVVKTAQAFRPHVLDMFEPQDHPDDIPYPGGPPRPPYDATGYTLAFQMGVEFERVLDGFDGPFEKINGLLKPPPGSVTQAKATAGYLVSHEVNDAFVAVNRLLEAGEEVYWTKTPFGANGRQYAAGTMFIPAKPTTVPILQKLAAEKGLVFDGTSARPAAGDTFKLRPVRVGLWDQYGGSMPSGWVRWLFEQYEFPFEVVYPQTLDAGNLAAKYDVLVFVDGGIPDSDTAGPGGQPNPETIPIEFRNRLGRVTVARTVPELRKFLDAGGTILAIGSSTSLGYLIDLPMKDALVEKQQNGTERPLPVEKFYVPGSVLEARVDISSPLAYGLPEKVDVYFDNSPVFRLLPDARQKGLRPVAWFPTATPLRSGWSWGQHYLEGGVAIIEASVGKGRLFLFGPEIAWRGQPHGTFKFLFNGIYYGPASGSQ